MMKQRGTVRKGGHLPAGIDTWTVFVVFTLPRPPQVGHSLLRGIAFPSPMQTLQVLAIWKPPSITNVRVPDPPQAVHVFLFAPVLSPVPEHVLQSAIGVTLTDFLVPLQASIKVTCIVVSIFAPLAVSEPRDWRAPKEPKSWSKISGPCPLLENAEAKSWNPEKPPAENPPALLPNALGSNPGCCE